MDFDGNCAYGTGGHQWIILATPNLSCIAGSSSGISYRYSSNGWSNCISYVCTSYRNSVTCGENLFGAECEDEWTYLYVR